MCVCEYVVCYFKFVYFPHLEPSPRSPHCIPLISPSHFTPPHPFRKKVDKKLRYRGQNAFSVIRTDERHNTVSEHIILLFLFVCQYRLAGGIMFSICPFVRAFVRLLPTLYVRPILRKQVNRCQCKSPPDQGYERSTSGVRLSGGQSQGHRRPKLEAGGDIILDPLSRVNRGMH